MPGIDPALLPVVSDAVRGLQALGVPFALVGALVPELLLDVPPTRRTNDADLTVVVESLAEFDDLKRRLSDYGFAPTSRPYRLQRREGGLLDILPFSETLAPDRRLRLGEDLVFNMAGFDQVVRRAILVTIEGGPMVPVAPLPLYVLLKLVAFGDRKQSKDLASVLHCQEHYQAEGDRRYGLEHEGRAVPFEFTCAYLLGLDARPFLDEALADAVRPVLARFEDSDAAIVDLTAREKTGSVATEELRAEVFDRFRWFRLALGL